MTSARISFGDTQGNEPIQLLALPLLGVFPCRNSRAPRAFCWPAFHFFLLILREQCVAPPNDFIFDLEHIAENFARRVVARLSRHRLVTAGRQAPIVLLYLLNRHAIAVRPLLAARPLGQQSGMSFASIGVRLSSRLKPSAVRS